MNRCRIVTTIRSKKKVSIEGNQLSAHAGTRNDQSRLSVHPDTIIVCPVKELTTSADP